MEMPMKTDLDGSAAVHIAVVYAIDGVRLVSAGESQEAVAARLAEYVGEQAEHALRPDGAARIRALLRGGSPWEAVQLYFARVGERWDREYLQIQRVEVAPAG
jgi:hypothetical protein